MGRAAAARYNAVPEASGYRPGARGADGFSAADLDTRVLIVEDEAMIAWMLESLLEDMGFSSIAVAASGEEAVEEAARNEPGLIVSDINLGSGIDGVAAAARIQGMYRVPVLFVSGHASNDVRARIDREVADAVVLRKPIVIDELSRGVARAMRRAPLC